MQHTAATQPILDQARRQEEEYDWLGAAESYKRARIAVPANDQFQAGKLSEKAGYASYKAALQAETSDDFRERIHSAISEYERASEGYESLGKESGTWRLRSKAMAAYLNFWLASEPSDRRRLLGEVWTLAKEALRGFEEASDAVEYMSTYDKLAMSAAFSWLYESDSNVLERTLKELTDHGQRVVQLVSEANSSDLVARAYVMTASSIVESLSYIQDPKDKANLVRLAVEYWAKAKELAEESAILGLSFLSTEFMGPEGSDEALGTWRRALELGRKTRDRLFIGSALSLLAYNTAWKAIGTEDPDMKVRLVKEAFQIAEDSKRECNPILLPCPSSGFMWAEAPHAEYYYILGVFESDPEKKRELWKQGLAAAPEMLKRAEDAGYPATKMSAHHVFSKVLASTAKVEKDPRKREELLEMALEHRREAIRLSEQWEPFDYMNKGVAQHYLAEIESQLSTLAKNPDRASKLLHDAIRDKGAGLELRRKLMPYLEDMGYVPQLAWTGEREYEYGNMLWRLYDYEKDRVILNRAVAAFTDASRLFLKANMASRRAECYWRAAQSYDVLEDHLKAAETFLNAAESYKTAAQKLPQLGEFYGDHASYMRGWSAIEKARYHHGREEYREAQEYYSKAADLHKSTRRWNTLASNYSAWARLEKAEDLSRKEQSQRAVRAFREAAELFKESKRTIKQGPDSAGSEEEKQLLSKLAEASEVREEYCTARVWLEEAKVLDKTGEHRTSAEKYRLTAETLEKMQERLESKQSQNEVKLILILAKAWQMMARAEAEVSPALYLEASRLFEEAKELSPNEKARLLALGHSRFCGALEAGARFADRGDETLHSSATQHLESAAKYYVRAGFQNASDYAQACKLLFDAYAYMNTANREKNHEAKAKLFILAEKVLASSADFYARAGQSGKRDQVLGLLETVKEEKELAVSLTEVFHPPPVVSTTAAFSTPTPTYENAVGLERFENADVQVNMITRRKSLNVGELLELELEFVNAGKGPAQLVKMEELVPEGFELAGKPEAFRMEDSYLNMRGKRLDPLKTEEVKLTLKPRAQGRFTLKPRILYLDESGKYKSHEPEPLDITVKELGITGWLKGH